MNSYLSITPARMRSINQAAILEYIRMKGSASRSELSRKLNLSLPSIVRITDDLIEKGFLCFSGEKENSGGRRRPLLTFDTENNVFIGVKISDHFFKGYVLDLSGNVLTDKRLEFKDMEADEAVDKLKQVLRPLVSGADETGKRFRGISIIIPCVVNHKSGIVTDYLPFKWNQLPLKKILEKEFHTTVIVENDANAEAYGELWYGKGKGIHNLLSISLRNGLGVGLILNGAVYRGLEGAAGEIGNIVLDPKEFQPHRQQYGPGEKAVAGDGLILQGKKALADTGNFDIAKDLSLDDIFRSYKNNESWATLIISNFQDKLAEIIIMVDAVINPEKVILQGELMKYAPLFLEEVRKKLYQDIDLETSEIGEISGVLGGVVELMHFHTNYYMVQQVL